jgi:acyl carrier protein
LAGKIIATAPTRLQGMRSAAQESETLTQITEEIIDLVKTEAVEADLTAESNLQDVGLDSLKFMSVVFKVEARYDIELQEEDADDLRSIGDLAALVVGRIAEGS